MRRWFRRRAGEDERAPSSSSSAVAMVAMIGATALAVDVGQVTNNNRSLQAMADVIAMDAGRAVTGGTAASLSGASGAVVTAAQASATRNNLPLAKLTVDLGTLSGSTFTLIATPLLNGVVQTVTSTSVPTAVRVTASGTVNFAFQRGAKTTNRSATAVRQNHGRVLHRLLAGQHPGRRRRHPQRRVRRRLPPQRRQLQRAWSTPTSRCSRSGSTCPSRRCRRPSC